MIGDEPRVSIGLPVFNGENYLAETLESLLAQTFSGFELIISDNASTDRTEEICRVYAAKDHRILYYRNEKNIGAAGNFNRVFALSNTEYFKWASHDDLCAPTFMERCVEVLDQDSSVVLSYPRTREIDEHGKIVRDYFESNISLPKPSSRFFECVCVSHPQVAVCGVIRRPILQKTRLFGNYKAADRVLLGELCLLGRFYQIPQYLFFFRNHPRQHYRVFSTPHLRQKWYDPAKAGRMTFPQWRLLLEHFRSINRVPLTWQERIRCYMYLIWWIRTRYRKLARNLILK